MVTTQIGEETAKNGASTTAKIHVSPEVADLLKVYCVLHGKRMVDYASEVLGRDLQEFRERLELLRKID